MKPSVAIWPRYVIVGTSTMAMPVGLSETNARRLSARNTVHTGAFPVAAPTSRLASTDQLRLASSISSFVSIFAPMMATSAVAPSGETLT